jgi:hypothetical protein
MAVSIEPTRAIVRTERSCMAFSFVAKPVTLRVDVSLQVDASSVPWADCEMDVRLCVANARG